MTEELVKVLSDLKNAGHEVILVSSGAIGMGVGKLSLSARPTDMSSKQACAAVLSVVAGLRSKSFTLGCLSFAGCCVALTALFLLKSSWLTEAFSAVLSALCLFTPFEEFVNSSFSIPTLVYYLTVAAVFLFFTAQGLEKRRWN